MRWSVSTAVTALAAICVAAQDDDTFGYDESEYEDIGYFDEGLSTHDLFFERPRYTCNSGAQEKNFKLNTLEKCLKACQNRAKCAYVSYSSSVGVNKCVLFNDSCTQEIGADVTLYLHKEKANFEGVPTRAPTKDPTSFPTVSPIVNAPGGTHYPTKSPVTSRPTKSPVPAPTRKPTTAPTFRPTKSPVSSRPTKSPVPAPTPKPTTAPTFRPTKSPVSSRPTKSPIPAPTRKPTAAPSTRPTRSPTSSRPTRSPIPAPTRSPTMAPSTRPTLSPLSSRPTASPTALPTKSPTLAPSMRPTLSPTQGPTSSAPTKAPNLEPTRPPVVTVTGEPTAEPTREPTTEPTREPSAEPTAEPTTEPTAEPTGEPTGEPTREPTREPTSTPTAKPTVEPTLQPSVNPTGTTTEPTLPTIKPTASPTKPRSPPTTPSASPPTRPPGGGTDAPSTSPIASDTSAPTALPTSQPSSEATEPPVTKPETIEVLDGQGSFTWTVLSADTNEQGARALATSTLQKLKGTLKVDLQSEQGWASIGISDEGSMKGSHAMIGYSDANKAFRECELPEYEPCTEQYEGDLGVEEVTTSMQDGILVVDFVASGIAGKPFQPGVQKLVFASSIADDFVTPHNKASVAPVTVIPLGSVDIDKGNMCEGEIVAVPQRETAFTLSIAMSVAGILVGIGAVVFLIVNRDLPVLKMSQFDLHVLFGVCLIFLNISILPRSINTVAPDESLCVAFPVIFNLSYVLAATTLAVLQWRSWLRYSLFMYKRQEKIRKRELIMMLLAPFVAMIVVLLIWLSKSTPTPNPCKEFRCTHDAGIVSYSSFCIGLIVSLVAIAVAILSGDIPTLANQTSSILTTMMFAVFGLFILGLLGNSEALSPAIETLLLSFTVLSCTLVGAALVIFRKMLWRDMSVMDVVEFLQRRPGQSSMIDQPQEEWQAEKPTSRPAHPLEFASAQTLPAAQVILPAVRAQHEEEGVPFMPDRDIIATNLETGEQVYSDGLREKESPELDAQSHKRAAIQATGFKVGRISERHEEYVSRETGEPFWLDLETLEVTYDRPDALNVT